MRRNNGAGDVRVVGSDIYYDGELVATLAHARIDPAKYGSQQNFRNWLIDNSSALMPGVIPANKVPHKS